MYSSKPYVYKNLKQAYDSLKAQYNSDYLYDITLDDNQNVVIKVMDKNNKEVGYLEDY